MKQTFGLIRCPWGIFYLKTKSPALKPISRRALSTRRNVSSKRTTKPRANRISTSRWRGCISTVLIPSWQRERGRKSWRISSPRKQIRRGGVPSRTHSVSRPIPALFHRGSSSLFDHLFNATHWRDPSFCRRALRAAVSSNGCRATCPATATTHAAMMHTAMSMTRLCSTPRKLNATRAGINPEITCLHV